MALSEDNREIILSKACTSVSSIIGGVTSFMTNYFISKFPDGFFKKIYISDSFNPTNLRRFIFQKQPKPYFFIQPQFELGNLFMEQPLPYWYTTNYYVIKNTHKNYVKIFEDTSRDISIFYVPNRIKVTFQTGMRLQTQMQAWDVLSYMNQNFEATGFNYVNGISMQAEVPKTFMVNLCRINGWNYNTPDGKESLKKYLSKYSLNGINPVINTATSNISYMSRYFANILINYQDHPTSDKVVKNLIQSHAQVNYAFSAELWIPGAFIMEINKERMDLPLDDSYIQEPDNAYKFTLVFNKEYIPDEVNGLPIIFNGEYVPDINVEVDVLDLKPIISEEVVNIIKSLSPHYKLDDILIINVYANGKKLTCDMYEVDWHRFILKTLKPETNKTYSLFIYGDLDKLHKINEDNISTSKRQLKEK